MDKYLIKPSTQTSLVLSNLGLNETEEQLPKKSRRFLEVDLNNLPTDPGIRPQISEYHPSDWDRIRIAYLLRGPCQPRDVEFPKTLIGSIHRRFNPKWYDEFGTWLEYSPSKNAVFCLCCYLMGTEDRRGSDVFISIGFGKWKDMKVRLQKHMGGVDSSHNKAWRRCEVLMNEKQHRVALFQQSTKITQDYQIQLTALVDSIRFLLRQGLAFHDDDEAKDSINQGNFLQLLQLLANQNETIGNVLKNDSGKLNLVAPNIQKEIVSIASRETTNIIVEDIGDDFFAILIDECWDISIREQMSVVLRYVNKKGQTVEHFLSLIHVTDTSACSLKEALDFLLAKHNLNLSKVRGQSYNISNIHGEFNGLKSLILKENAYGFYVHCFAHQLQLALVIAAKKQIAIACFFSMVANVCNVVGASCKRQDVFREKQKNVVESLQNSAEDIRWGSHYGTLLSIISLFSSVIDVLEMIEEDGLDVDKRGEACALLNRVQCFEFIFCLHLMKNILGITEQFSQALQRKDQDIVNAMNLLKVSKLRLHSMRDKGWMLLLNEVSSFCGKHYISLPTMSDMFDGQGRSRRKGKQISNLHHYQVNLFYQVIDMQLHELNHQFDERSSELLLCVACLNPRDSFAAFNKEKLLQLARFYPNEFSSLDVLALDNQLENYIMDMRLDDEFSDLKGINDLSEKLVEKRRHTVYQMVYLLLKLALILPVAPATVERTSCMSILKDQMPIYMEDDLLNDCFVTFIEREIFDGVDTAKIIQRYQQKDIMVLESPKLGRYQTASEVESPGK